MARIAVISDLHIGENARSPDLNPHPSAGGSDGFLEAFSRFAQKEAIRAEILLVPGDISDKAHPNEYKRAETVIKAVADAVHVPHDRVYPVLGNHDLNWALIQAFPNDTAAFGAQLRFHTLQASPWLSNRLLCATGGSQIVSPFLCIDETDDFLIVRYNSAEADLPTVKPHRGAVEQAHLEDLANLLADIRYDPHKTRIFLTHHHPVVYSDPIPNYPDFSALVNAENLVSVVQQHQFDLFIHGHKHAPRFRSFVEAGRHALSILCAGSFSRSIDSAWTGWITNQFHLIHCARRDTGTGFLCGDVRSWAFKPSVWVPSDEKWSGIRHRLPFGAYPPPKTLSAAIQAALLPILSQRTVVWSDVVAAYPGIEFADAHMVRSCLTSVAQHAGAVIQFDERSPSDMAMARR